MAVDPVDLKPKRFTTDELPARERLTRWREEFGRTIVKVDIEPVSTDAPFKATAILQGAPGLGLSICDGDAAHLHRTRALAADGDDSIGLIVNLGAPAQASQRGADVTLAPGDGVFVLTNEPGVLRGATHLGLVVPRTVLAQRLHEPEDVVMRPIPGNDEALRQLVRYLHFVKDDIGTSPPALREAMIGHIHDLMALAMGANREIREQGKGALAAARLAEVIDHIGRHFADPSLSVAGVARQHRISSRYLQELLEQSGASFVARVNELRLRRAFALLTRFPDRPVSEIAAQAGFSNISHFNRLFRARFGDSPSGVRSRS